MSHSRHKAALVWRALTVFLRVRGLTGVLGKVTCLVGERLHLVLQVLRVKFLSSPASLARSNSWAYSSDTATFRSE
jgi:hypothetical protein